MIYIAICLTYLSEACNLSIGKHILVGTNVALAAEHTSLIPASKRPTPPKGVLAFFL